MRSITVLLVLFGAIVMSGCLSSPQEPAVQEDSFTFQPEFVIEEDYSEHTALVEQYLVKFILRFDAQPNDRGFYCSVEVDGIPATLEMEEGGVADTIYTTGGHKEFTAFAWKRSSFSDVIPVKVCCSYLSGDDPYCSTGYMQKTKTQKG